MNDIISGGISGILQIFVGHPLDTIKTRLQYNKPIIYNLNNLYKGIKYPLYSSIIINSFLFKLNNDINIYTNNHFISGGLTGIIMTTIKTPIELHKIKAQNNINKCKNIINNKIINNKIINNIKNILKYNYRGIYQTLIQEIIGKSLFFGTYNKIKEKTNNIILSGGLAGIVTWTFTYPFDVIKTRIQSNIKLTTKEAINQKNIWKGFYPCIIRSFIVNSVGFTVYEECNKYL